jgi:hypothetical protein
MEIILSNNRENPSLRFKNFMFNMKTKGKMSNFKQLKDLLNDGSINLKVYIDRIVDLYRFEPKKKYTEELEDTDDSDSEIEYDSDESVASEEDEEIDTEATTSRPLIHTEATTSRL